MEYAGFWVRFVAYLIDTVVVTIASFLFSLVVGFVLGFVLKIGGMDTGVIGIVGAVVGYIIGIVMTWLYFAVLESSASQATLGKQALGLIVTDTDGYRIGFGRATGRYFAKILSGMILLIGYIMIGFSDRKQGLHDVIASTLVIKDDGRRGRIGQTFA